MMECYVMYSPCLHDITLQGAGKPQAVAGRLSLARAQWNQRQGGCFACIAFSIVFRIAFRICMSALMSDVMSECVSECVSELMSDVVSDVVSDLMSELVSILACVVLVFGMQKRIVQVDLLKKFEGAQRLKSSLVHGKVPDTKSEIKTEINSEIQNMFLLRRL